MGLVIYSEAFIKNPHISILEKIRDSKKLSPKKRAGALELINAHSMYQAHTLVSNRLIDKLNINRATEYSIKRLLDKLPVKPDLLIMDGNFSFNLGIPTRSFIKGDSISISIASASIIAKVKRDRIMENFNLIYPGYSFKKNKGYGTKDHLKAINLLGPSPIHRKSYEPVRSMIECPEKLF